MIVTEALRPARESRPDARQDGFPRVELDAVALAVVEADRLDARIALERPGKAGRGILSSGEEDQRSAGQDQGWAVAAGTGTDANVRDGPRVPTSGSLRPEGPMPKLRPSRFSSKPSTGLAATPSNPRSDIW
jgi:hypothetical protein